VREISESRDEGGRIYRRLSRQETDPDGTRGPRVVLMNKRLISSPARATGRFISPVSSGRSYSRLTSVTLLNRFPDVSHSRSKTYARTRLTIVQCNDEVTKASAQTNGMPPITKS